MTLGVSNVSRIHFGFEFTVNPDPDSIIEYPQSSDINFMELYIHCKRRDSCAPYVGKCSSGNVQQIQYGGGNRDQCGLKADNKFLSDAKYTVLCLKRDTNIVLCHF